MCEAGVQQDGGRREEGMLVLEVKIWVTSALGEFKTERVEEDFI